MGFLRKISLLLFFSLFCFVGTAQEPDQKDFVLFHDTLTTGKLKEIHLSSLKGWKFTHRDESSFSSKVLDDSDWFKVKGPLNETKAIPDSLWKGFGWFRLKVKIDSSFSSAVTFQSYQGSGAVELYINDSLILKRGNPSASAPEQKLEPVNFSVGNWYQFTPGETYQLAVKYSFHNYQTLNFFQPMNPPRDLGIHLFPPKNLDLLIAEDNISQLTYDTAAVILLMVMSLHLFFYLKIRHDRKNFWIFLMTLLVFLFAALIIVNTLLDTSNYYLDLGLLFITRISITLIVGFLPLVLHKVLEVKAGNFWKIFTIVPLILDLSTSYLSSRNILPNALDSNALPVVLIILTLVGGCIALVKAHKRKRRDMSIVAGSFLGFPTLILLAVVAFNVLKMGGFLFGTLVILCILTVIPIGLSFYQGKRFLRLHNEMDGLVAERTTELQQAMENLEQSNKNLKAAQDQLVQQEKLASLGQLTAGIAHEIKNPLNFVTNFSEVCLELIGEAKTELQSLAAEAKATVTGTLEDSSLIQNIKELLETVQDNLHKIQQHGNRADGIVKSMLLHSRGGSGKPQPVYFNLLVTEFVNLAYHGMRAGKNPFDVNIIFELNEDVGEVNVVREDFSRVILNLCNNAFDAMREKLASTPFSPELLVQTKRIDNVVQLTVQDNGPGIPEEIKDKVLEPFFTTKKGTEGTGLGLSITNDIIKAHGGKLDIESSGRGTKFILHLSADHMVKTHV